MSDLLETLRAQIALAREYEYAVGFSVTEAEVLLAALEDRDRLREAAAEVVTWIAPWEAGQGEPTETCPGCKLSRLLEVKPS